MSGSTALVLSNRSYPTPVVSSNFAKNLFDWETLSSVSSMPTGGSISRAGNAMLYDSTGKLTYAPNNLYINSGSATNTARTITTQAGVNYYIWIQTSTGTATIVASGTNTSTFNGSTSGTYTAFTATAGTLTLTPTSNFANITQVVVAAITYETALRSVDNVVTSGSAYYGPRFDYDPSTLAAKGLLVEGTRTNLLNFSQLFATSGGAQNNWADTNITRNSANNTSPDGTGNALRVTASAANGTIISSAAIGTSAQRVLSVWLRRVTGTGNIQYTLDNGTSWTTQAITSTWTRYSFSATTADQQVGFRIATSGDAIEIWGAQLEAGAFATSYVPTTTGTVSRAAETFTITGYANRLLEAYYIDQETGVSSSIPETVVSSGAVTINPPSFGWVTSLRAYTNAYAGDIATPSWLSFSRTGNAMYYDSTGTLTWAPSNMLLNSATLSTQTVTVISGATNILSFSGTGSITYSGAASGTLAGTGANDRVSVVLTMSTASLTLTVSGTVSNAQLERVTYQTRPRAYIPTTSAAVYGPRYDYDPSTVPATPRGLLIEESRANIVPYSQSFNLGGWTLNNLLAFGSGSTLNTTATISPDGTNTSALLVPNTTGSVAHSFYYNNVTVTAQAYTFSVYVKAAGYNWIALGNMSTGGSVYFNISTGAVGSNSAGYAGAISSIGNGWYRCTVTWTATAGSFNPGFYIATGDGGNVYAGNGTSGIYVWGYQLEAGSFATSYIPTLASSVTRAADVAQLTGSALTTLQGTQATLIAEAISASTSAKYLISARKIASGNYGDFYSLLSTYSTIYAGSSEQASMGYIPLPTTTSIFRAALAIQSNNFAAVANNGTVQTDTSGSVVTGIDQGWLGGYSDGVYLNGYVRSLALYNQRLPNAILKQKSAVNAPY